MRALGGLLALLLLVSVLAQAGARADAGPLDGGIVDAAPLRAGDFAVRPVSPVTIPDAGTPAPAPWWRQLVTAGATLGGVGILLAIRHYWPDAADPCAALSTVR